MAEIDGILLFNFLKILAAAITEICWPIIILIKVSKLLISHHHPDHIGLSKFLSEKLNIKVYAPKNEILRAEKIINLSDKEYGQMLSNKYEEFGLARKVVLHAKTRGNFYRSMIKTIHQSLAQTLSQCSCFEANPKMILFA